MSGRKIDYFGTFLDSMQRETEPATDPANVLLKALKGGARHAKDLIPLVGNSVSRFISVSDELSGRGWVQTTDGGVSYALTDKGREIADVLD